MFEYVDRTNYTYKVADINLADAGRGVMSAAQAVAGEFGDIRKQYDGKSPLKGKRVLCSTAIDERAVAFVETLVALGADVRVCANGTSSTVNELAALLASREVSVFAWRGESLAEFWWCARKALDFAEGKGPDIVVEDGGRMSLLISKGVEFSDHPELYSEDYSEADEDTLELVELLRMVRGRLDWHRVAGGVKLNVSDISADGVRHLLGQALCLTRWPNE